MCTKNNLTRIFYFFIIFILVFSLPFFLSCGGGGSREDNNKINTQTFSGYVIDSPISGATVEVYDNKGSLIVRKEKATDEKGHFEIDIPKDRISNPLIFKAYNGYLAKKEPFKDEVYSVCYTDFLECNITPITTIVYAVFKKAPIIVSQNVNYLENSLKILGYSNYQSIDSELIKKITNLKKKLDVSFLTLANIIADDISDGFIDNTDLKEIFPTGIYRHVENVKFDVDWDSVEDYQNRTFKFYSLKLDKYFNTQEAIPYSKYNLEISLVEEIRYMDLDGLWNVKYRTIFLPLNLSEYKNKLNIETTIFAYLFLQPELADLPIDIKRSLIDKIKNKYKKEYSSLQKLYKKIINKDELYRKIFLEKIANLASSLRKSVGYVNIDATQEKDILPQEAIKSSGIKLNGGKNYLDTGIATIKYSLEEKRLEFKNYIPLYLGMHSINGNYDYNIGLKDSFNDNLFSPNPYPNPNVILKFIGDPSDSGMAPPPQKLTCEEFDGNLCKQERLIPNVYSEYYLYKDMFSLNLPSILNWMETLRSIPKIPIPGIDKTMEKIEKSIKGFKSSKWIKSAYILTDTAISLTQLYISMREICSNESDVPCPSWIYEYDQNKINTLRNLLDNIETALSYLNEPPSNLYSTIDIFEGKNGEYYIERINKINGLTTIVMNPFKVHIPLKDNIVLIKQISSAFNLSKKDAIRRFITAYLLSSLVNKYETKYIEKYINKKYNKNKLIISFLLLNVMLEDTDNTEVAIQKLQKETDLFDVHKSISSEEIQMALLKVLLFNDFNIKENLSSILIDNIQTLSQTISIINSAIKTANSADLIKTVIPYIFSSVSNASKEVIQQLLISLAMDALPVNPKEILKAERLGEIIASNVFFPSYVPFSARVDDKGENIIFGSIALPVLGLNKGLLRPTWEDKYKREWKDAFLYWKDVGVIITGKEEEDSKNVVYYIPYYQIVFNSYDKDFIKDLIEQYEDKPIFGFNWKVLKCNSVLNRKEIDNSSCKPFNKNNLLEVIKASDITGFFKNIIKTNGAGYVYIDIIDVAMSKLGWDFFPVRVKTNGIFVDSAYYNIFDNSTNRVIKGESGKNIIFRFANNNNLKIRIENKINKNGKFIIHNNNNFDVVILIFDDKENIENLRRYYSRIIPANSYVSFDKEALRYLSIEGTLEKVRVLVLDKTVLEFGKFEGINNVYDTLKFLAKNKGLNLEKFISKYNSYTSPGFIKIMRRNLALEDVPPVIEEFHINNLNTCKVSGICEISFKVKDNNLEQIKIDFGDGNYKIYNKDFIDENLEVVYNTIKINVIHKYPTSGNYKVSLKAEDTSSNYLEKTIETEIKIKKENTPPIAKITTPKNIYLLGETVILDGRNSYDPEDGKFISYEWYDNGKLISNDSLVTKSNFTEGTHSIILKVKDSKGAVSEDNVEIIVKKPASKLSIKASLSSYSIYIKENEEKTISLSFIVNSQNVIDLYCYYEYKGRKYATSCNTNIEIPVSIKDVGINTIVVYSTGYTFDGEQIVRNKGLTFKVEKKQEEKIYTLKFLDENYKDNTKININDNIQTIDKQWTLKMSDTHSATLVLEKDTSKTCNLTINGNLPAINVSLSNTFNVNVKFDMPTSTGNYQCYFKIKDTNGNYYKIGNSNNLWIKVEVVANDLTAFINTNAKEITVNTPLTLLVNIQNGNPPYELTVNWGDGSIATTKTFTDKGDYFLSHTYTSEGNYTIEGFIVDKAGKTYSTTINVKVLSQVNTTTSWAGKLTNVFDVPKESNIDITSTQKTTSNGITYYEYSLNVIPSAKIYYKGFILPVPKDVLNLNNGNVKFTFVVKSGELKYYDREIWISTDTKKIGIVPIDIGYYNEVQSQEGYGKVIIKDFTANSSQTLYKNELNDSYGANALSRYSIELTNDSFTVYSYNSTQKQNEKLFTEYTPTGNYITEINLNFKGNGKLILAVVEYDTDKDGTYDKKLILNTKDKIVDWSSLSNNVQNNKPVINSFTADKTTANVGDTITFSYDVSDPDRNSLTCEFDFDGDGRIDRTIKGCQKGKISFKYVNPGSFEAKIYVSNKSDKTSARIYIDVLDNYNIYLDKPEIDTEILKSVYTVDTVTIRWKRVENAVSYEIQIDKDKTFVNPTIFEYIPDKLTPYYTFTFKNLENGIYYFRIRAKNGSTVSEWSYYESFEVQLPSPPSEAIAIYPEDGATDIPYDTEFNLQWQATDPDGDIDDFWIFLDENYNDVLNQNEKNLSNFLAARQHTSDTFISINAFNKKMLPCTTYYWKVITIDKRNNRSESNIFKFTTECESYDLIISRIDVLDEIKPNSKVALKIFVKNIGSKPSESALISLAYNIPDENKTSGFMDSFKVGKVNPGEEVAIDAYVEFKDSKWTDNNGIEHDLVLRSGTTYIVATLETFDDLEVNKQNNVYKLKVEYTDDNVPVIETVKVQSPEIGVIDNYVYTDSKLDIYVLGYDNSILKKIEIFGRINNNWQKLKEILSSTPRQHLQGSAVWDLKGKINSGDNVDIKIIVYDDSGNTTQKIIGPYKVIQAVENAQILVPSEGDIFNVGDTIPVQISLDEGAEVYSVNIYYHYGSSSYHLGRFTALDNISVKIPDSNLYSSDNAYLEVVLRDIYGREYTLKSGSFRVLPVYNSEFNEPIYIEKLPVLTDVLYPYQKLEPAAILSDNNYVYIVYSYKERYVLDNPDDADAFTGFDTYEKIEFKYKVFNKNLSTEIDSGVVFSYANKRNGKFFSFEKNFSIYDVRLVDNNIYILYGINKNNNNNELYILDVKNRQEYQVNTYGDYYGAKLLQIGNKLFISWRNTNIPKKSYIYQYLPFINMIYETTEYFIYPDDTVNSSIFGCNYRMICSLENDTFRIVFDTKNLINYLEYSNFKYLSGSIEEIFYKYSDGTYNLFLYNSGNIYNYTSINGRPDNIFGLSDYVVICSQAGNNLYVYQLSNEGKLMSKLEMKGIKNYASDMTIEGFIYVLFNDSELKVTYYKF